MMELKGTLTLADFARFHYFHWLRRIWLAVLIILISWVAIIAFLAALLTPDIDVDTRPVSILLPIWLCLVAATPFLAARRQFKRKECLHEPIIHVFTVEGINSSSSSVSSEVKWRIVQNVRETSRLFRLHYSSNQALIIPKRFFSSPEQIESWRRIVETSIAPRKISKSGFIGRWL
jgi:hypothetical protein